MQPSDKQSCHLKLHASEWAPNNRYRLTAPPTSHEELEELSSSKFLKYIESHHPESPPEIANQDKVFLAEHPKCLAME
jgi:hypothetical protein